MEGDHAQAPATLEELGRGLERLLQRGQLLVDSHAQSLEGARGHVRPVRPGGARHAGLDRIHQLRGGHERGLPPPLDDAAGDAPSVTLLPVLEQNARELGLGEAGQEVGGGTTVARIEAHIEGLVVLEAEAAAGGLELIRRQPEVEEDRGGLGHAGLLRMRGEVAETALPEGDPLAEALEALPRSPQSFGIAVEAEQTSVLAAHLQQPLRVATHADRYVHHPAPASGAQAKRHFVQQHREVRTLPLHALHALVGQLRLDVLDGRADLVALVVLEALAVPHLEALLHADDQRLLGQALALPEVEGDLDASLGIEDHVLRPREVLILEGAAEGIEPGQTSDAIGELVEIALGVHVEATTAVGHDDELVSEPVGEQLTKSCGNAEPPLRIHRVPEMSPKHAPSKRGESLSPHGFRTTSWDFIPPSGPI